MISSRPTNRPFSRTSRINRSIGMRSMRTGFPPQVSSYRLTSRTNGPSWTTSEGMETPANATLRLLYLSGSALGHESYRQSTGALHCLLHDQVAACGLEIRVRLKATQKLWRQHEIAHRSYSGSGGFSNVVSSTGSGEGVYQLHHYRYVRIYDSRPNIDARRAGPRRWHCQNDLRRRRRTDPGVRGGDKRQHSFGLESQHRRLYSEFGLHRNHDHD